MLTRRPAEFFPRRPTGVQRPDNGVVHEGFWERNSDPGRLIRVASPDLDKYELLDDPEAVLTGLRSLQRALISSRSCESARDLAEICLSMEWDNLRS